MRLMLKDSPLLEIDENGACQILDFERLPFALRKQRITLVDFVEWASGRTLSIKAVSKEPICCMQGMQGTESRGFLLDPARG